MQQVNMMAYLSPRVVQNNFKSTKIIVSVKLMENWINWQQFGANGNHWTSPNLSSRILSMTIFHLALQLSFTILDFLSIFSLFSYIFGCPFYWQSYLFNFMLDLVIVYSPVIYHGLMVLFIYQVFSYLFYIHFWQIAVLLLFTYSCYLL